ncbi:ErfK/YbiS/YcfS/YnhG family protein [Desulfotomaculum nigrificans CO-1-SRB]|uniref:ErfK/YbiS/YcfS/YnhG family protein n=1 Tax=Desulfotomaculum nigrificans (strain DSM 14880 / VKM B-2319 / CO-1-SRB) TaxID=868595 RepID=F6B8U6_DESCC|nr:L,D-transpeptidase family protein [Desulfotomaculum nigrificans]AEF94789.1 ErfK/YbiS/YcfS/YnhG family protein [Desulfotomaculum nigrificans CO-1-SRB]
MTLALYLAMSLLFSPGLAAAENSKMIIINKKTNQLGFYQNGVLTNVFPVATGRRRSFTPEGTFKVINKQVNPPYYKKHIPGGSPYNPLGPRWLGLSAPGGPYGIHGNNNPASIGTYASNGCIRLHNKDILWLYDQVPIGTPVIIVWNDVDLNNGFIDNTPIKLYFNNEPVILSSENPTFSRQDKPYVPLKVICRLLDYDIKWNQQTGTIDLVSSNMTTTLTPDSKNAYVNGHQLNLTNPPVVMNGITYVTTSTLEEIFSMNMKVSWNTANRELRIIYQAPVQPPANDSQQENPV